jgi:type I restriction-modification system DNA methylase subunit
VIFVDDLAQLLADTDIEAALKDFGARTKQADPIPHFYETFLTAYDPKLRELRGVYHTPAPVVGYIVRSVDALLKRDFGARGGLAEETKTTYTRKNERGELETAQGPRVLILDPACATGMFLHEVVEHIRNGFQIKGNAGMWPGYVRDSLLPRIFGFELLMAPYAMAHLKLGMQLAGLDLPAAQREAARLMEAIDAEIEARGGWPLT